MSSAVACRKRGSVGASRYCCRNHRAYVCAMSLPRCFATRRRSWSKGELLFAQRREDPEHLLVVVIVDERIERLQIEALGAFDKQRLDRHKAERGQVGHAALFIVETARDLVVATADAVDIAHRAPRKAEPPEAVDVNMKIRAVRCARH